MVFPTSPCWQQVGTNVFMVIIHCILSEKKRWKKRKKKSLHRIRDLTVISTLHGSLSDNSLTTAYVLCSLDRKTNAKWYF